MYQTITFISIVSCITTQKTESIIRSVGCKFQNSKLKHSWKLTKPTHWSLTKLKLSKRERIFKQRIPVSVTPNVLQGSKEAKYSLSNKRRQESCPTFLFFGKVKREIRSLKRSFSQTKERVISTRTSSNLGKLKSGTWINSRPSYQVSSIWYLDLEKLLTRYISACKSERCTCALMTNRAKNPDTFRATVRSHTPFSPPCHMCLSAPFVLLFPDWKKYPRNFEPSLSLSWFGF